MRALVADGLPLTGTYHVAVTDLAAWTRTARGGPGRRAGTWAWRCWPCLRAGRNYRASTGGIPVPALLRLAAARMLWASAFATVTATKAALVAAVDDLTAGHQAATLDAAVSYLTPRHELRTEPPTGQLLDALIWHEPTHADTQARVPHRSDPAAAIHPQTRR